MVDTTKNTKLFTTYGVTTSKAIITEVASKLISKAKRPLLVVGTESLNPEVLDRAVKISQKEISRLQQPALRCQALWARMLMPSTLTCTR